MCEASVQIATFAKSQPDRVHNPRFYRLIEQFEYIFSKQQLYNVMFLPS